MPAGPTSRLASRNAPLAIPRPRLRRDFDGHLRTLREAATEDHDRVASLVFEHVNVLAMSIGASDARMRGLLGFLKRWLSRKALAGQDHVDAVVAPAELGPKCGQKPRAHRRGQVVIGKLLTHPSFRRCTCHDMMPSESRHRHRRTRRRAKHFNASVRRGEHPPAGIV
jgi:hypothetical protein